MLPLTELQMADIMSRLNIKSLSEATIRQIVAVCGAAESVAGEPFIHLEVGNPGLPPTA